MKNKKILPIIFGLILLSGYIYFTKSFTSLGASIFLFSLSFIATFIVLLFVEKNIFFAWGKFAFGWMLLSIFLVLSVPDFHSGLIGFDKKLTSLWMSTLFFIISLVIIATKSLKLRGK